MGKGGGWSDGERRRERERKYERSDKLKKNHIKEVEREREKKYMKEVMN